MRIISFSYFIRLIVVSTALLPLLAGGCHSGSLSGGNPDAGARDAGIDSAPRPDLYWNFTAGYPECGNPSCPSNFVCKYSFCIPYLGSCIVNNDCPGDSYCDADKTCVPYGVPAGKINDPGCQTTPASPGVKPTLQCEWTTDGTPTTGSWNNLYTTPIVANLNLALDLNKLQPSIVVTTFTTSVATRAGMLRVFDGRTCTEQLRIGGPDDPDAANNRPAYGTQWAVADLDGDVGTPNGHPEIVGLHRIGLSGMGDPLTLIAFSVDTSNPASPKLQRKWLGRICGSGGDTPISFATNEYNFGPGIWDLNDDGVPEIVLDQLVFDANGCLLNPPASVTPYINHGVITAVADVDLDGKPDLVRYDGVYGWDNNAKQWVLKPYFTQTAANSKPGHVAVADLGLFSSIPSGITGFAARPATDPLPEIIVTSAETTTFNPNSTGSIRAMTITGQVFAGPYPLFHQYDGASPITNYGGHGGPPTAADFDGDGQIEFAAAANQFYTLYDPDCDNTVDPTKRPGGRCDQTGVTYPFGLSSFPPGILWAKLSQDYSSSETGSSIFDFDADGTSEAVYRDECYLRVYDGKTGTVIYSAPASSGTGQEMPTVVDVKGTYHTEIVVPRAANGGNCPSPDPLFPASGAWTRTTGFEILRDPMDRWASSRAIWNQHAYSVTNVLDDARVPRSSAMLRNWQQPGLNNFRQNVQGTLGVLALADLTVQLVNLDSICARQSGSLTVYAQVCNRGTNPVQDGATVSFYQAPKSDGGLALDAGTTTSVCSTSTARLLNPGDCTQVSCTGTVSSSLDLYVVADPDAAIPSCNRGNSVSASALVLCPATLF